jgi:hypothetical protein
MAEINIEQKKTNIWPWLIGGAVLLALLWMYMSRGDSTQTASAADSTRMADSSSAAGTLAPPMDSIRRDSVIIPPPR